MREFCKRTTCLTSLSTFAFNVVKSCVTPGQRSPKILRSSAGRNAPIPRNSIGRWLFPFGLFHFLQGFFREFLVSMVDIHPVVDTIFEVFRSIMLVVAVELSGEFLFAFRFGFVESLIFCLTVVFPFCVCLVGPKLASNVQTGKEQHNQDERNSVPIQSSSIGYHVTRLAFNSATN